MVRRASKEGEVRRSAVLVGDLGHAKFLNEILFETSDSERGPSRARLEGRPGARFAKYISYKNISSI